jgi:hypothetical protein
LGQTFGAAPGPGPAQADLVVRIASVKDQTKNRLAIIDARFARRGAAPAVEQETFEQAFLRVRDTVILPVMAELAAELRGLGHAPEILTTPVAHEDRVCAPAIALALGVRGSRAAKNQVVFAVIRWKPSGESEEGPEVLAFHVKDATPFDLFRYMSPDELDRDKVEQLVVDSIEALFAQSAASSPS